MHTNVNLLAPVGVMALLGTAFLFFVAALVLIQSLVVRNRGRARFVLLAMRARCELHQSGVHSRLIQSAGVDAPARNLSRWSVLTRATLYAVMLVSTLGSLAIYGALAFGPSRRKPGPYSLLLPGRLGY
jgi:hypothetical protein